MEKVKNILLKIVNKVWTYCREMCDVSSIHGIRYLTEKGLHWSERLWWIFWLCVSIGLCFAFVTNIWVKWQEIPVKLSFTEEPILISSIPLPTVTFCPGVKAMKEIFDVESVLANPSEASPIEKQRLGDLAQYCPYLANKIAPEGNFVNDSIYENIKAMAYVNISPILFMRGSGNANGNQKIKFASIITDQGYCFTFNPLISSDIYTDEMVSAPMAIEKMSDVINVTNVEYHQYTGLQNEINRKWNDQMYPLRLVDKSPLYGLAFNVEMEVPNVHFKCSSLANEYTVSLSAPGEVVKVSSNYHRVSLSEVNHINMNGRITTTSEGLRKYDPKKRQCYFDDERQLRFFKIYTQSNCEEECLAELTNINCGCVHFAMPRNKTTLICGAAKMTCYQQMAKHFHTKHVDFKESCNCLPACTSMEYNAHIERVKLDWNPFSNDTGAFYNRKSKLSAIVVYSDTYHFETIKRMESNTIADILATFGGLLGLFMGISVLSVVELIFYATLHVYWTWRPMKISEFLTELFKNSNIHGVLYFTRPGLHWTERLWWISAVCLSTWLSALSTDKIWQNWQNNPVALGFTRDIMHVSEIPFPTVTICPEIKSLADKVDLVEYSKEKPILTEQENIEANALSYLAWRASYYKLEAATNLFNWSDVSIFENIADISPRMHNFIRSCRFRNVDIDCNKYIVPIHTDEGYCFTFNALNSHETYTNAMEPEMMTITSHPNTTNWSFRSGYKNQTSDSEYPLRVFRSGHFGSLEISFALNDRDFIGFYRRQLKGSIVFFTMPGNVIMNTGSSFQATLLDETRINIKPKFIVSSEALRKYDPSKRRCFFEDERKLRFFKKYSERNCKEDCVANLTYSMCGCVRYTAPRIKGQRICGAGRTICYWNAKRYLTKTPAFHEAHNFSIDYCNCLPTCSVIEYNAEIERRPFDPKLLRKIGVVEENGHTVLHGKLTISFEDDEVTVEDRIEPYTVTDFMATCGGLLGLFMGVSALSLVEIFYLCTLRWYWRQRHQSSEDDPPEEAAQDEQPEQPGWTSAYT